MAVAVLICLNFLANALEAQLRPARHSPEADVFERVNIAFTILFTVELGINFYGTGPKWFWRSWWNVFDFTIVTISISAYIFPDLPGFGVLRLFRAFRIFRLFKDVSSLGSLLAAIAKTVPVIAHPALILVFVLSIWSLFAVDLFHDVQPTDYGSFLRAFFTMFEALTGMSALCRTLVFHYDQPGAALFYGSFHAAGVLLMLNIVVAMFLETILLDQGDDAIEEEPDLLVHLTFRGIADGFRQRHSLRVAWHRVRYEVRELMHPTIQATPWGGSALAASVLQRTPSQKNSYVPQHTLPLPSDDELPPAGQQLSLLRHDSITPSKGSTHDPATSGQRRSVHFGASFSFPTNYAPDDGSPGSAASTPPSQSPKHLSPAFGPRERTVHFGGSFNIPLPSWPPGKSAATPTKYAPDHGSPRSAASTPHSWSSKYAPAASVSNADLSPAFGPRERTVHFGGSFNLPLSSWSPSKPAASSRTPSLCPGTPATIAAGAQRTTSFQLPTDPLTGNDNRTDIRDDDLQSLIGQVLQRITASDTLRSAQQDAVLEALRQLEVRLLAVEDMLAPFCGPVGHGLEEGSATPCRMDPEASSVMSSFEEPGSPGKPRPPGTRALKPAWTGGDWGSAGDDRGNGDGTHPTPLGRLRRVAPQPLSELFLAALPPESDS